MKTTNNKTVMNRVRDYVMQHYEEYNEDRTPPKTFEECARYIRDDLQGHYVNEHDLIPGAECIGLELPIWDVDEQGDLETILEGYETTKQYEPAESAKLLRHLCAREINRVKY